MRDWPFQVKHSCYELWVNELQVTFTSFFWVFLLQERRLHNMQPVSVPQWGLPNSLGKCNIFKNFPGCGQEVVFPSGRHKNRSWNIRELNCQIPGWPQKRICWVTFKGQKAMSNTLLVVKSNKQTIRWIVQLKLKFMQR